MTIINPKSIAGVTSITTPSGSDNLFTVHTNNTTERVRINNDGDVIVGSGITVSPDGDIFATGVCTATSFVGSGANLTGVASTENIRTNTNATFLQNINVSGSTTTGSLVSSGAISGTTGTFTGDVDIADKIVHTGDTNTAIRFPDADTISVETGGSERARFDSNGRLLLGNTSGRSVGDVTAQSQIEGTTFATSSLSLTSNAGASAGNIPHITLGKSRGSSDGSNTIVADGDKLGIIQFAGADGTDCNTVAASILSNVDGAPGSNDMPGRLTFNTTADGSSTPSERLRIQSDGDIIIGDTDADAKLHVHSPAHYVLTSSGVAHKHIHCSAVNGNAGEYGGAISFGMGSTGAAAVAGLQGAADADNVGLAFITHNSGTGADNASEMARLTSTGKFLIGRTSNSGYDSLLQTKSITVETDGDTTGMQFNMTDSNAAWVAMRFYVQDNQKGYIQVNTGSVTYSTGSDYR